MLELLLHSASASEIFDDTRRLQAMLDFESALSRAQASLGVIPRAAAEYIASSCRTEFFNYAALAEGADLSGNLAIPMVKQLTALVRAHSAEAAGFVHWGATSQDAIDTGLVLQLRAEFSLLEQQLTAACDALATLTREHRNALMAGRTWLQQAVPITFGLKLAGWLDALLRHRERLAELKPRVLVVQFGGAAGTLASLGDSGLKIGAALADELQLKFPTLPWQSNRDRVAEVATFHGLLMGTLGKIARDLSLLMQTEVAEIAEPAGTNRGGSSTMPQKRNPIAAASILSAAMRVPGLVGTILSAMVQEHERGLGGWHTEWETLPQICTLTLGALEKLTSTLKGLEVFPEAMRKNLDHTHGFLLAEALSMELAKKIGKEQAHKKIEAASHHALTNKQSLRETVERDVDLMQIFNAEQLTHLFEPQNYLGDSQAMIDRVLLNYETRKPAAGKRSLTVPTLALADVTLHYEFDPTDARPVLVFSNSLGTNQSLWSKQIESFSQHFSILRYDSRGQGRSTSPSGLYTIAVMGQDLLHLLNALGLGRVGFCGISMGGMLGQWLGIHAPDRVRRMVLSNTAANIGTTEFWDQRIATVNREGMRSIIPAVLNGWFTEPFRRDFPSVLESMQAMLQANSIDGYTACCAAVRDMDQREDVHLIKIPTLIVYGTEDKPTPPEKAMFLIDQISGSRGLELHAAHISNIEAASAFNEGVLRFLLEGKTDG